MTDVQPERREWDRRPEEPSLWYERFTLYRNIGVPSRSVAEAYREWRVAYDDTVSNADECSSPPGTWYTYSKKYDWSKRATAYDDYIREAWSDDETIKQAKLKRIAMFTRIAEKYGEELIRRKTTDTPGNQVTQAMKTASRELREELGTGKPSVTFSVILDQLPPDVQKSLIEQLDLEQA